MINQKGQSTVEYLLLLVMVMSILFSILRSSRFTAFFGQNGTIATEYREQTEFTYRHGYLNKEQPSTRPNYRSGSHDSYSGKLFSASDPYPNN